MENFKKFFNKEYTLMLSSAGRVNLIGEHIDYCGGKVLPISLNLSCKVYSAKNNTGYMNLAFKNIDNIVKIDLNDLESYKGSKEIGTYQAGVCYTLKKLGYEFSGLDMYFDCDIPFGSGLSSSAGIEVSTMLTILTQFDYPYSKKDVAIWCQKTENEYCKVNCGIMDQFASSHGKKNMAMLLDCKKIECEYIPCDFKNYSLLVCNCNKPHNLIKSEYNTRRQEVETGLKIINDNTDLNLTCLADLSVDKFNKISKYLNGKILNRVRHVVYECDRVKKSVEMLKNGDIVNFGKLLNESHYSLRDDYETTGVELDTLSELMRTSVGCIGARMTGAGFGGCCICLVENGKEDNLKKRVIENYKNIIGYEPTFYDVKIEDGIIIHYKN